jgi:hypothetical protein
VQTVVEEFRTVAVVGIEVKTRNFATFIVKVLGMVSTCCLARDTRRMDLLELIRIVAERTYGAS